MFQPVLALSVIDEKGSEQTILEWPPVHMLNASGHH